MFLSTARTKTLAVLGVCVAGAASADVTFEQAVSIEAGGMLAMFGASGTTRTTVAGEKAYSETDMESQSTMGRMFSRNLDSATIVRLDRGLMWNLAADEKKYAEVTFEQMREQLRQNREQMAEMQGESGGLPVSDDACVWSDPRISVNETGEKERIAGERTKQHLIQVSQTCEVPNENKSCDMTWTIDTWLARKVRGGDEVQAFQNEMASQLEMDEYTAQLGGMAGALMAMYGEGWDDAFDRTDALDGFPMRTILQLEIGGDSCTLSSGTPIAMDEAWSDAVDAAGDAAVYSAAGAAGAEVGEAVGGGIAGSAIGAASREIIGGMFKSMKKKKKEEQAAEQPEESAAAVVMFRISTEMTEIDREAATDETFEVPADWEKVESVY